MKLSEKKQWAREHFRGVENSLKTPFSPDFQDIDEDGIRIDVRHGIAQGCFASMCSSNFTTQQERKRFIEIVCDEAAGRIQVGVNAAVKKPEDCLELLIHGEKCGCTHAFIEYPRSREPASAEDVYRYLRQLTDATDLAIILYGYHCPVLRKFHPSGILMDVFDRLADVPNVIGMKLTQPMNPVSAFELADRLADRLLLGPANIDLIPGLCRRHNIQWVGQWVIDSLQSPQKPYLVEFMDHIHHGRLDQATALYWQMAPANKYVCDLQRSYLLQGSHPWAHINYYHWCVGGNGGLPRGAGDDSDRAGALDARGRQEIRKRYGEIGISPVDGPEEEFIVGKANYQKGVRASDLARMPMYLL